MTKTIENLKAAITGESTASATYAAYAAKAAQEGQPLIQKLFEAASKAESVHAANHNKVLEKLGATMEPIDIQIHVGTTAENLKAAIAGETHEFESMYPEFIAVAEEEGQKAAVRSYNRGMINRCPRTRCGDRLVKPFSAGENIHLHALLGFAVGNDVLKLIHIINIAGPEI